MIASFAASTVHLSVFVMSSPSAAAVQGVGAQPSAAPPTSNAEAGEGRGDARGEAAHATGASLDSDEDGSSGEAPSPLRRYLARERPPLPHFLDHGVLQVAVAGGMPHLYRAELSLGLLDHLSVGADLSWRPSEARPRIAPRVALAVYRARWWAFGFRYTQVLHLPPVIDTDPQTPDFVERSHYVFGTAVFSQRSWSAGLDAGIVHTRDLPLATGSEPAPEPGSYRLRTLPAGGLFLRYGTRRWGLSVHGQMPVYTLELALDLRFGLFELRPRGGWRPDPWR